MNLFRLVSSVLMISLAAGVLQFADKNYELLKADVGVIGPLLALLFGLSLGLFGLITFFRSFQRA